MTFPNLREHSCTSGVRSSLASMGVTISPYSIPKCQAQTKPSHFLLKIADGICNEMHIACATKCTNPVQLTSLVCYVWSDGDFAVKFSITAMGDKQSCQACKDTGIKDPLRLSGNLSHFIP